MTEHVPLPQVIELAQAWADADGIVHYITPIDGGGWLISRSETDGGEPFIVIKPRQRKLGLADGRF